MKKIRKKLFFVALYEQRFSNLTPFLSITLPQGLQISKKFGHWTLGSGTKKTVKQSEKVCHTLPSSPTPLLVQ